MQIKMMKENKCIGSTRITEIRRRERGKNQQEEGKYQLERFKGRKNLKEMRHF